MRRGDVYEYVIGSHRARILIVSATHYNPGRATFAVVRQPTSGPLPATVAVPMSPDDPVAGAVDLSRLRALDDSAVRAHLGRLTADTMRQVDRALRTYLSL